MVTSPDLPRCRMARLFFLTVHPVRPEGGAKVTAYRMNSFWRMAAASLLLAGTLGQAATLYTFSNNGANAYSFSLLEPGPLTSTGSFAIPPFQAGGLTFTQASLTQAGGTECFQFGTAGATLTATPFSCGLSAFAPDGGWQSLFFGAAAPGTYAAFNAISEGSAPPAPDQLTIIGQPEPASWALFCGGAAMLAAFARRRKRRD